MRGMRSPLIALTMLLLFAGIAFAQNGYGTSAIVLSKGYLNVTAGGSASVNYAVNLASGSTWGTTLVVTNAAQLQQQGITFAISNPSGDPPFTGLLTVITSTTTGSRVYSVKLAATGDDPSLVNAVLNVSVTGTQVAGATTTVAQQYYPNGSGLMVASLVLIILIAIAVGYLAVKMKTILARLALIGAGLILIGTVVWIYGDYAGGSMAYVWGGVAAIAVGTLAWVYGDIVGGTFKQSFAGKVVYAGVALIVIGTALWLYADYYGGGFPLYLWSGVALIVVGTAAWLYGDAYAGAFLRSKKEKA